MGTATIEVSGPDAARWAAELHGALSANAGPGDSVSPVEVRRSAAMVIAVIGLVFSGVEPARTIWDWWNSRRPGTGSVGIPAANGPGTAGTVVKILLSDGTQVDVSTVNQGQLEITFRQHESEQHGSQRHELRRHESQQGGDRRA